MLIRPFFTFSGSTISKLATWATGKPWGHTGIVFECSNAKQFEAFEARSDQGFVGPYDFNKTVDYITKRHGRILLVNHLSIDGYDAASVYDRACSMAADGNISYSKPQLALMFLFERYGIKFRPSKNKIVCSEAIARLLYPFIDLRDVNHPTFDTVTPNSAYYRICEIQAGYQAGALPNK